MKKGVYRLKKLLYPERQSLRLEPKGKSLKDSDTLKSLGNVFLHKPATVEILFTDCTVDKWFEFTIIDSFVIVSGLKNGSKLYVKDLGPQIGWSTVFLCEYAGPLFSYLLFYLRPSLIYGEEASAKPMAHVVQ